ncbi:MAG TPA: hypothetical protein PK156_18735 [Polyangium sp.]|nr:hypothetical protein [Polyangium sp.]
MNDRADIFRGKQSIVAGAIAFVLGAGALGIGFVIHPIYAYAAYLSAYAWAFSMILGALLFLMIAHAMAAQWPVAIRRVVEAIVGLLPLGILGFIPIVLGMSRIFPWANPNSDRDEMAQELWTHQRPYLNPSAFLLRAMVYFILWLVIATLLRQWSLRQDLRPEPRYARYSRTVSAVGLFPVALAMTFASFDWLMSLSPAWYSTMFGVYWFAGGFLAAICLIVVIIASLQRLGMCSRIGRGHYHALGRLMLTFTIFWAYAAYFQLFLIWMANKPPEVLFYALRATPEWLPFGIALAMGHFVGPFLILLLYRVKQSARSLAPVAGWLLLAHWMDMQWLVMPVVRPHGPTIHWVDVAAMVGVAGALLTYGSFRLRGHSVVPKNEPLLEAAYKYEST